MKINTVYLDNERYLSESDVIAFIEGEADTWEELPPHKIDRVQSFTRGQIDGRRTLVKQLKDIRYV